jgi:hypothetical protein
MKPFPKKKRAHETFFILHHPSWSSNGGRVVGFFVRVGEVANAVGCQSS